MSISTTYQVQVLIESERFHLPFGTQHLQQQQCAHQKVNSCLSCWLLYHNQILIDCRNYYYHSNINLFLPALQLDRPVPLYKEDTEDFNLHICRLCTILVPVVIGNHNKPQLHLSSHDCIERIERLLCSFHPRTLHNTIHTQSAPYPHCFYIYQTTFTKQHSKFYLLYSDKLTTVHQQHVKWKRAVTVVLSPTHGPQFFGGPPATRSQTFWDN